MGDLRRVADLTPKEPEVLKKLGERGGEITFTYPFGTGLLLHGLAKKISTEIVRRGMTIVDERHDGGLIFRNHVIVFRGNAWEGGHRQPVAGCLPEGSVKGDAMREGAS